MLELNQIEITRFIESKGFDVFPIKQKNGMFKVSVWQGEKSLGIGKFEYKCWKDGVYKTRENIYKKINKIV